MSVIQTVRGDITPNLLGRTLTHEHFSLDFQKFYSPPPEEVQEFLKKRITLETSGFIRQYPYSNIDNLKYYDNETIDAVKYDVELFKKFGGSSIVENTSHGLNRNLEVMYDISKKTGVHVIAGTGHYVYNVQKQSTLNQTLESMTELYSKEIITGCDIGSNRIVKCGFIGEVGSGWPIHEFEKKAIAATGEIQEVLGCAVSFHPGRHSKAPFEVIRLYLEAGGKANKCIMSHLERTIHDIDELLEFAKLGTFLQYDLFGIECSHYQMRPEIDMPSDGQRIDNIMKLISEGLEDRILFSQDIHTKHRLIKFGGHGFSHIYNNILPRFFAKGLTVEQVEKITVQNPAKWLAFNV